MPTTSLTPRGELEALMRNREFYVDESSRTKVQENQNTINNLMNKVQELQYENNCSMIQRISRTPNRCTVDNFHTFPVIQR